MKSYQLPGQAPRTHLVVLDQGEEVVASLESFARQIHLQAAHVTAIGAYSEIVLGFFDRQRRDYDEIVIREQVEVLTLVGNFAEKNGRAKLHAHVVVGKRDGTAHGGHLLKAEVSPTLEVVIVELPGAITRRIDPATGLPLIHHAEASRATDPAPTHRNK